MSARIKTETRVSARQTMTRLRGLMRSHSAEVLSEEGSVSRSRATP